jgi:tellurite resistance protein TerC
VIVLWISFLALIVVLLALDLGVFHRKAHDIGLREAGFWSAVWIAIGLSFSIAVYFVYGSNLFGADLEGDHRREGLQASMAYVTAYLVEKSLSVDNIFVIAVVFDRFKVKPEYRHRVLFWGILGAILMRGLMIGGGLWLVERFTWLFYVFGLYLVYTGVKLLKSSDEEVDPERSAAVRLVRRVFPVSTADHGATFVTRVNGRLTFTVLALVLIAVEWTDVVFALDSIPAVLAISEEAFIVYTSNIFAILGLRSLYFVLQGMMHRFRHLKYSLSFILVFIGAKMALHDFWKFPTALSLSVILAALVVAVGTSIFARKREERLSRLSLESPPPPAPSLPPDE